MVASTSLASKVQAQVNGSLVTITRSLYHSSTSTGTKYYSTGKPRSCSVDAATYFVFCDQLSK